VRTTRLIALTAAIGVSFLLVPSRAAQTAHPSFTTLYSFTGQNGDGNGPEGNLAIGRNGALYGTTAGGGIANSSICPFYGPTGCGTVFALAPPAAPGAAWTESVLHQFTGQNGDGFYPFAGVVIGSNGVLYGATYYGGAGAGCQEPMGCGTVYQLTPSAVAGGAWTETILHGFTGQDGDGSGPVGTLAIGKDGALYGMTVYGGPVTTRCPVGCGIVFQLTPPSTAGGTWTETVIYSPSGQSLALGSVPDAGLTIDKNGSLYGTATAEPEPAGSYGTVFRLTPPDTTGGEWMRTILFSFNLLDGATPMGNVAIGPGGKIFGATAQGGGGDCPGLACGTVFELSPPAAAGTPWTEDYCSFGTCASGWGPMVGVVIDKNGVLYGATPHGGPLDSSTVFALMPPAAAGAPWTQTALHSFASGTQVRGLAIGSSGVLYGTILSGGALGAGSIFAWTP